MDRWARFSEDNFEMHLQVDEYLLYSETVRVSDDAYSGNSKYAEAEPKDTQRYHCRHIDRRRMQSCQCAARTL